MIAQVTSYLYPVDVVNMHLTCRRLHKITRSAEPFKKRARRRFHRAFEASARRKAHKTRLDRLQENPWNTSIFSDSQARPYYELHGRVCFKRGVMEGFYNLRTALYNPEDFFSCFGYSGPKQIRGGGGCILRRCRDLGDVLGRGGLIRRTREWCKLCSKTIMVYANPELV
ncbi:hypothetical protein BDR22DRAFT_241161 [Usnea florida]